MTKREEDFEFERGFIDCFHDDLFEIFLNYLNFLTSHDSSWTEGYRLAIRYRRYFPDLVVNKYAKENRDLRKKLIVGAVGIGIYLGFNFISSSQDSDGSDFKFGLEKSVQTSSHNYINPSNNP